MVRNPCVQLPVTVLFQHPTSHSWIPLLYVRFQMSMPTYVFSFAQVDPVRQRLPLGPGPLDSEHRNLESFIFDRFYKGLTRFLGNVSSPRIQQGYRKACSELVCDIQE